MQFIIFGMRFSGTKIQPCQIQILIQNILIFFLFFFFCFTIFFVNKVHVNSVTERRQWPAIAQCMEKHQHVTSWAEWSRLPSAFWHCWICSHMTCTHLCGGTGDANPDLLFMGFAAMGILNTLGYRPRHLPRRLFGHRWHQTLFTACTCSQNESVECSWPKLKFTSEWWDNCKLIPWL